MKKYIKPNMEVSVIEMEEMIAASLNGTSEGININISKDEDFAGGVADGKDRGGSDWGGLW